MTAHTTKDTTWLPRISFFRCSGSMGSTPQPLPVSRTASEQLFWMWFIVVNEKAISGIHAFYMLHVSSGSVSCMRLAFLLAHQSPQLFQFPAAKPELRSIKCGPCMQGPKYQQCQPAGPRRAS